MNTTATTPQVFAPLSATQRLLFMAIAVASFHVAYAIPVLAWVIAGYLAGLAALTRSPSSRSAFYSGFVTGLAVFVPHMMFLWKLFGIAAVPLWCVMGFWIGMFVLLGHQCWLRWPRWTLLLLPFLWTGLEFFRSELYYLRFTWLTPGFAFSDWPRAVAFAGVYGLGFLLMFFIATVWGLLEKRSIKLAWCLATALILCVVTNPGGVSPNPKALKVAGVQMEFPASLDVPPALAAALRAHPEAELFVLSEYTFDGPVPPRVRDWCQKNRRHLIVGGKDEHSDGTFYNTAFVVGPDGGIVFKQAKAVPIQFFKDGLPAPEQKLWDSPWGKLGICICYDLSFAPVTDKLIRLGAEAIINPTMDVNEWGERQHHLHARLPLLRAAEYNVPIFRVASSGISQIVDANGKVTTTAPFFGQGEIIGGTLLLHGVGRIPSDRYLVWPCVIIAWGIFTWALFDGVRQRFNRKPQTANPK
ncbi:MAG: hypothetical protein HY300_07420 [Verrucomicrobia bacterium]|nr:hypothetical protein [Verrucomicrobiota bacterium]